MEIHTKKGYTSAQLAADFAAAIGAHPHVSETNSTAIRKKLTNVYSSKLDTRIAGPFYFPKQPDDDLLPEMGKYEGQNLFTTPYAWQQELITIQAGQADERTIYWRWSESGKIGKSALCKWLAVKRAAYCLAPADCRDLLYGVSQLVEKYPTKQLTICVDIPRAEELLKKKSRELFSALEQIKNGCIYSSKYMSANHIFWPPHVFIFSNRAPNTIYLSSDRWNIKEIRLSSISVPTPKRPLEEGSDSINSAPSPLRQRTDSPRSENREHADGLVSSPLTRQLIGIQLPLPLMPSVPMSTGSEHFLLPSPSPTSSNSTALETESLDEPWGPTDAELGYAT
jgi:hypothetical protein